MNSDGPNSGGRWRLRIARRPVLVTGLAALIAAGAGGTAMAAALGHHSQTTTASTPAGSVFVPYPGSGAPGANGASGAGSTFAAPAPAMDAARSAAAPGLGASSSYLPPYYGGCTPQAAQIQGSVITATGATQIDVAQVGQSLNLNAGVEDHSVSDAGTALRQAQAKVDAIVAAIEKAGIPRSAIHSSYYSVYPYTGGPKPLSGPGTNSVPQGFEVNGSVSAQASDLDQLARATNGAAAAGASSVSVSSSGGYNVAQPSDDKLRAAIAQATAAARQMATAAADAAGVHLGGVHSLVVAPPAMCGYGVTGPQLSIAVTSAWDVK
jgi:uncharacterized protein YggE